MPGAAVDTIAVERGLEMVERPGTAAAFADAGGAASAAARIARLTAGMAAGDAAAVEAFYRGYFARLYRDARRATGRDEAFCLDVVQESVLRVVRTVRRVESEAQFNGWLKLVVRTTAYDLLRAEGRRKRREAQAAPAVDRAAPPDAERLAWLRAKIAALDPRIVRMIELRFTERWPLRRIAGLFGVTVGTVDGRLRRALRHLRDLAREEFDDE